jgi:hypothetical protein
MARVDSENSTAVPVDPTRRRFLSTTATLAAGGAALGLLAIPPALGAPAGTSKASPQYDVAIISYSVAWDLFKMRGPA